MAESKFTPSDLAAEIGISPKECRKFLRSITKDRAGKGGRWSIDGRTFDALVERYPIWKAGKVTEFVLENED